MTPLQIPLGWRNHPGPCIVSEVPTKYPQISSRRQPLWHSNAQRKARIKDGTSSEETVSICQNNSLQDNFVTSALSMAAPAQELPFMRHD
ncbi:hypothetical protein Taro_047101 [Colocasia esculenta]|uniref:Uncharacterized protein n=1 Tax=Colocasia esculenta TaxID=4460 RepID=A0A843X508_COLES|nr:hypothetical protein [Colocasia esculenta]